MNSVILAILKGEQLIATLGPVAIGVALEFRKLFANSDLPYEVQIQQLKDGVVKTITETDAIWADWTAKHPE